jgi:hypothetical protein
VDEREKHTTFDDNLRADNPRPRHPGLRPSLQVRAYTKEGLVGFETPVSNSSVLQKSIRLRIGFEAVRPKRDHGLGSQ